MKNNRNLLFLLILLAISLTLTQQATSQELKWLCVGQLQSFIVDYGAENELHPESFNTFAWPALYGGYTQHTSRAKGLWLGAENFYDPLQNKIVTHKVIGSGPRYDEARQPGMIFSRSIKLIARSLPPKVIVDGMIANAYKRYDEDAIDEEDENLPCDRMVIVKFNTSLGISVTKKVMAFSQQNHDDYYIYEYVFKNTGIYDEAGHVYTQTVNNFIVHFNFRYAFAGVTSSGWGSTWGAFSSEWGASTVHHDFGPSFRSPYVTSIPGFYQYCHITLPTNTRGFYAYYGPHKDRPLRYDEDWGCPRQLGGGTGLDGLVGSAKYAGVVVLFASKSPQEFSVDDINQPTTTSFYGPDERITQTPVSQFDDVFMEGRWQRMTEGHLPTSFEEAVGTAYASDYNNAHPNRMGGEQGLSFGPYTLAPGDSIRIVYAEGVNGLSWEKCREIGDIWYKHYSGTGSPPLIMPDGSVGSYNDYLRGWVQTGRDSLFKTFNNAINNFKSNFNIPRPPDPPRKFEVSSGGDKIMLRWEPPFETANLAGYVIYRAEGSVGDYRTFYEKVFECNQNVTAWDDTSAKRGKNYYYLILSKDDGTRNDVEPGVPLYSSPLLTMPSVNYPAQFLRKAGNLLGEVRVVPNPFDARASHWQFGTLQGTGAINKIAFFGIPGKCMLRIFTEDGTLIWEKYHFNGSGDDEWDCMTSSGQIVASGIYILHVEVTEDIYATEDRKADWDIYDENLNLLYPKESIIYRAGDKIFTKGQFAIRKFVVIR